MSSRMIQLNFPTLTLAKGALSSVSAAEAAANCNWDVRTRMGPFNLLVACIGVAIQGRIVMQCDFLFGCTKANGIRLEVENHVIIFI